MYILSTEQTIIVSLKYPNHFLIVGICLIPVVAVKLLDKRQRVDMAVIRPMLDKERLTI